MFTLLPPYAAVPFPLPSQAASRERPEPAVWYLVATRPDPEAAVWTAHARFRDAEVAQGWALWLHATRHYAGTSTREATVHAVPQGAPLVCYYGRDWQPADEAAVERAKGCRVPVGVGRGSQGARDDGDG